MDRSCGNCTACCKTLGVKSINKFPGEWCKYCNVGKGCQIYKKRPEACQQYSCAWLQGHFASGLRPNLTQIIPEYIEIKGVGWALWLREVEAGSLKSSLVKRWTRKNLHSGVCVMHVASSGNYTLYLAAKVEVGSITVDNLDEVVEIVDAAASLLRFSG